MKAEIPSYNLAVVEVSEFPATSSQSPLVKYVFLRNRENMLFQVVHKKKLNNCETR